MMKAAEERAAAIEFKITIEVGVVANLASAGVISRVYVSVDDDAGSQASADGQTYRMLKIFRTTEEVFSQGKTVCIVINAHRKVECLLQDVFELDLFPRRDVYDIIDNSFLSVHDRGNG